MKRMNKEFGRLSQFVGFGFLAMILFALAGCQSTASGKPTETPAPVVQSVEQTATPLPQPTETQLPTATQQPTATAAPTELPTATAVPELAVLQDGFDLWCAPEKYTGVKPAGPDPLPDARQLVKNGENLSVQIPAVFCEVVVHFNQAVPEGAKVSLMDANTPFLTQPLQAVDGQPDEAWAPINHTYVVNPPYWQVSYQLVVAGPDGKELWSNTVEFAKPTPEECPYGGLPDPVTLWCTKADPWEVEPHPGIVYPYDHSKFEK
jgi:hypothetical protein